jgi:hypothetical protein
MITRPLKNLSPNLDSFDFDLIVLITDRRWDFSSNMYIDDVEFLICITHSIYIV